MDDFDRFLQTRLRSFLDPVVATPPPARGRGNRAAAPVLVVASPEGPSVVEPVVPVQVAVAPMPRL